jgi:hypothetical protein
MWPCGDAQIHTSCHAGGIASARMRASVARSRTRRLSASTYTKPPPARRRLRPERPSVTYASPAAFADSTGSVTTRRRAARDMAPVGTASRVPSGDGGEDWCSEDYQWTD